MAVAVDAASTSFTFVQAVTTSSNTKQTVGSGSNRALVVVVCLDGTSISATGVHWDSTGTNQAATLITSIVNGAIRIELWGLVAPTSGNKTLKVDLSAAATDFWVSSVAFTGVDQTGGVTSFAHANTGNTTSLKSLSGIMICFDKAFSA
jgi:hypothetical protein